MDKLIEYLNTGSCVAFVGAGPSAETGIPAWKKLAEQVYNDVSTATSGKSAEIREYYDQSKWPEFFGEVKRVLGEEVLYRIYKDKLKDPGQIGIVYSFLAKFPFQAFFTTNFDDVLRRHLTRKGIYPSSFLNRKKDFEGLDIDTLNKSIIKVHGDFSDLSTLVLTDEQYDAREVGYEYQYYRDCVASYFHTKRILFIGYSINDPDIQHLLKRIGLNLRRQIPLYAIVADARTTTVREWDRKYNIQVIRYNNNSGTHKELAALFEAIEKYVYVDGNPPPPRNEIDIKRAQSFYMWHRFQMGDASVNIQIDALKSVVLSSIRNAFEIDQPFDVEQVVSATKNDLGLPAPIASENVAHCLQSLVEARFLTMSSDSKYSSTPLLVEILDKYANQSEKLQETFDGQVRLDFAKIFPSINRHDLTQVQKAIEDVLVDVFTERGVEIVNMVFSRRALNVVQATNLFRLINRRALVIASVETRYKFIAYVTEMLVNPTSLQENILEYYSNAFFSMQALQLDPEGNEFRKQFLHHRTIILDSTILIPLLAKYSVNQHAFEQVILAAKNNGIQLITTDNLVDESVAHATWAWEQIKQYGEQSEEVLSAALGRPPFRRNAFLDGYIRCCTDIKHIDFMTYLETLFGGKFTDRSIKEFLHTTYGVQLFDFNTLLKQNIDSAYVKDSLLAFVLQKADEAGIDKTNLRARCEAEAYTIIKHWNHLKPAELSEEEWQCSFLSQGGFLNKIAKDSEFQLGKNIVVRIDALYEFLLRFGGGQKTRVAFKDILLSTYFRAADYFIDKSKYRQFFSTLINEAERTYEEGLDEFKKYVDNNLTTSSMDEFSDLEKPMMLAALQSELKDKLRSKDKKIGDLKKQIVEKDSSLQSAQSDLKRYKEKEERKRKYAEKQRKARGRRKGGA